MQNTLNRMEYTSEKQPDSERQTADSETVYGSPVRLLIITALSIFASEAVVMSIIYFFQPFSSSWLEMLFDSTLLVIMVGPMLYYFLFRPMLLHMNKRREVEELLRHAQEKEYKAILQTAMDGFWIADTEGRLLEVNDAYTRLTGYSRNELLTMRIKDVEAVESEEDIDQHIRRIMEIGSDSFETRHKGKDGKIIDVEISVNYNVEGELFFAFIRDITARKNAEEMLKKANDDLEVKVVERTAELWEANKKLENRTKELENRNRDITLIREMGELMLTCLTVEEAYPLVSQFASQLFPADSGVLFIVSSSRNLVEAASVWGKDPQPEDVFTPGECWALRRGQLHSVTDSNTAFRCKHVGELAGGYMCVPMMAQGETLGVIHLKIGSTGNGLDFKQWLEAKQSLFLSFAEQVKLAIANLKLRESLRNLSIRDPLTGLFNRRYMEESLEREISRANRKAAQLGIIMLDIDHFKRFNDTFGHDAGDTLLRELGMFLQQNVRSSDIACRYGGEEFTLILPDASLESARHRAEHLREAVKHLQVQHGRQSLGVVTLSLGVAVFPIHGSIAKAVLQSADNALYQAKEKGRNRVEVSDSQLTAYDTKEIFA